MQLRKRTVLNHSAERTLSDKIGVGILMFLHRFLTTIWINRKKVGAAWGSVGPEVLVKGLDQVNGSKTKTRKAEDQTDWQSNAHQTSCYNPWIMMGSLIQTIGPWKPHGLKTGNPEIHYHREPLKRPSKKWVRNCQTAVMLWQDADYHPLSWQKK